MDRSGQEVGNVVVTVTNPEPVREGNKVVVHNKINNLAGYTAYICNPICFRVKDDMEGGDRVPQRNLFSVARPIQLTNDTTTTHAPAGTPPRRRAHFILLLSQNSAKLTFMRPPA